jgi:hypothetical protein
MDQHDDRPSIFSRPPADDDVDRRAAPPRQDHPPTANRPIRPRPAVVPEHGRAGGRAQGVVLSRRAMALGGAGIVILAAGGFMVASVLRSPAEPTVADVPSTTASPTPEATSTPTLEATASPAPTPEPTPAGPPVEVAIGDWAKVTAAELHVRAAAGEAAASQYTLVRGAVVRVADGPQVVGGGNWYRVSSLGGATGWVSSGWSVEPFLETLVSDPTLIRCGEVVNPVFDVAEGKVVPREVLRIGDLALPSDRLSEAALGVIELVRGVGNDACITAQLASDGNPFLTSEPHVTACGHAVAEGGVFRLRPSADQDVDVAVQIKDPAVVHPALIAGPADNRRSSNLPVILGMMTNDGATGCFDANVQQGPTGERSYRSASIAQCSIVTEYNAGNLKLSPASGGPSAWIKLTPEAFQAGMFPLDHPVPVYVSASATSDGLEAHAWEAYLPGCG